MGNEINRDSAVYFDNVAAPRASPHRRCVRRHAAIRVYRSPVSFFSSALRIFVLPPFPSVCSPAFAFAYAISYFAYLYLAHLYLYLYLYLYLASICLVYRVIAPRYARILRYEWRESSFHI